MGSMRSSKASESSEVCYLMNECQQELVGIEVRVERDRLDGSVFSVAEVSQLGISRRLYKKIERDLFPKLNAIGNCAFGEMLLE